MHPPTLLKVSFFYFYNRELKVQNYEATYIYSGSYTNRLEFLR